ncbi:MAG: hypothetical protein WCA36_04895 [Pseudolabrys sp.]
MDKFGLVLRAIVFFLFPIPFLLSFAVDRGDDWTASLAYGAIAVLLVAAAVVGWGAWRRGD